ncbi:TRAP transporter substrate-binding protein DctP [Mameliella alba]|uniref:TRAP transporter substrate-binding protein DctP n=1 Tax=Mameliella alba TaxID=561184 RepID=UPI0012FFA19F|nr:TRAP transporter substrate-binding protein DctP [Mameliella alba]
MTIKSTFKTWATVSAVAIMAVTASGVTASAETTLRLITGWPSTSFFNVPLRQFVDEVNERGDGLVQIRIVGGPEVTPLSEQIGSLDLGVNDMWYGTISAFQQRIPEARALVLSDYTAGELRERGSLDVLRPFFDKIGLHFLGYFGSGYTFYVYLNEEPVRTDAGGVDLTGKRIRAPFLWHPVMEHVNATPINVEVAELYEALSRGRVDGFGWLDIGLTDFSWQDHTGYRITPNFWQGDVSVLVSKEAWNKLEPEAQELLTEIAIDYELVAHDYMIGLQETETKALYDAGMKDVELVGNAAAAYLASANDALWDLIEEASGPEVRKTLEAEFTR